MDKKEIKEILQEIEKEKNIGIEEGSDIDWKELLNKA